jgi:hypothetical protein
VSAFHEQMLIDAPVEDVWALVGDPGRYPEWWPSFMEVRGEQFEEGTEFVQVSRGPFKRKVESVFAVDRYDELKEIRMHCTLSGTFAHWELAPAQGRTFVDVTLGIEPIDAGSRVFDMTFGRRFFRSWLRDSITALTRAIGRETRIGASAAAAKSS